MAVSSSGRGRDNGGGKVVIIPTAVALAVISLAGTVFGYYIKERADRLEASIRNSERRSEDFQASVAATSLGSLDTGQKLCRVLQGKTWRDGLIVPQNWSVYLCQDYMKKSGGNGYQLGCIKSDGTILGGENGSLPSPNCGWR